MWNMSFCTASTPRKNFCPLSTQWSQNLTLKSCTYKNLSKHLKSKSSVHFTNTANNSQLTIQAFSLWWIAIFVPRSHSIVCWSFRSVNKHWLLSWQHRIRMTQIMLLAHLTAILQPKRWSIIQRVGNVVRCQSIVACTSYLKRSLEIPSSSKVSKAGRMNNRKALQTTKSTILASCKWFTPLYISKLTSFSF